MTIKYTGESKKNLEDRFAVIYANASEMNLIVDVLYDIDRKDYDIYSDGDEIEVWIPVDDKDDYNEFGREFRKTRKTYKVL